MARTTEISLLGITLKELLLKDMKLISM